MGVKGSLTESEALHKEATQRYHRDPVFHFIVKTAVGHVGLGLRQADRRDLTHEEEALCLMTASVALLLSERQNAPTEHSVSERTPRICSVPACGCIGEEHP